MIHIFDGAMGTMLQKAGLPPGYCPEMWNIEHPEVITSIHKSYIESGADIIETNTFGANRIKLMHYGLESKVEKVNAVAVQQARAACGFNTKIAGSVGPTGRLIVPLGDLSFEEAHEAFLEQISALDRAGVDMILIETIIDIQEMRAALLAAKAATKKPVICQMSYGADERTVTGTDPISAAILLEAMGADVIGVNCSLGPGQLLPIVEKLAKTTRCPVSVQANAGMPRLIHKQTVFPMKPDEMATWAKKLVTAGARFIGGCCGTTPQHIHSIFRAVKDLKAPSLYPCKERIGTTVLTSRSQVVYLGQKHPPAIIGERINPTGCKQLAADIASRQFIIVKKEALSQVRAGAALLDINLGVPGINQAQTMQAVIQELSMLVDVPLVFDTTDALGLEAALKTYPGRALINSVTAEPERLASFLPLAKKYGAAIICLPISLTGVPKTVQERLLVTQKIIHSALEAGLKPGDFILDALVLTAAVNATAGRDALTTLKLYREHFGYPTTMGLSNISFGLPQRDAINAAFCTMAMGAGLDAPIVNPYDPLMQQTLASSSLLLGHDPNGRSYSINYAPPCPPAEKEQSTASGNIIEQIRIAIISGEKEGVVPLVKQALKAGYDSIRLSEQALTTAMNEIGMSFGCGKYFLPQVLLAAESMRAAFETIKKELPNHIATSLGTVILATVKGDIHDLGKNIVAALLENNGFTVIDLGKDISAETIVEKALLHKADIVGLCALMTTTMPQIDNTIAALKAAGCHAQTIVGGAVLTENYAQQANADSYAANAVDAVIIAKKLMNKKK